MKHLSKLSLLLLLTALVMTGCVKDQCNLSRTYTKYTPVFISWDEFRSSVQSEPVRALENPGKMYFKDNYIYINEYMEGVHIVDNSDPSNPTQIGFIGIPGNVDLAVKGSILYADSWTDLVAIDISNPTAAFQVGRVEDVYPYNTWMYGSYLDPAHGVVKTWLKEQVTEEYMGDCSGYTPGSMGGNGIFVDPQTSPNGGGIVADGAGESSGNNKSYPGMGIGGSMAKITLSGNHLYSITDESAIQVFDLSDPTSPTIGNSVYVNWGIETLFPYGQNLFVGSTSGMYIMDNSDPANPRQIGEIGHISSCDPVVVDGDRAYVTLRNGTQCWGYTNQLEIFDVSNLTNPVRLATHPMFNPHGLGIDSETLFICDGNEGLKVYDVDKTDANKLDEVYHYENINTYDVIPLSMQKVLLMVGHDGLYQYDYSDAGNINLLSHLAVQE